jgi:hypothetical protein
MMAMAAALAKLIFARVMMTSKLGGGQQLGNRTIGSRCSAMFRYRRTVFLTLSVVR